MHRRRFLRSAGATALALPAHAALASALARADAGAAVASAPATRAPFASPPPLAPIRASSDRIVALTVCLRPFRPQGPRIEAERVGRRTLIHCYGHGGSGWSLSWGSAARVLALARATGESRLAVVGCGAIGLTCALAAQRAGLRVRIYARELLPDAPSARATGVWSPASRICTSEHATPAFERDWQAMTRASFRSYQSLLGVPGAPVAWRDGYVLSDLPFDAPRAAHDDGEPEYPSLESRLVPDLGPRSTPVADGAHPFPVAHVRRYTQMVFNIAAYSRLLMDEFRLAGGEVVLHEFADAREFARLRERTVVNAAGHGARVLVGDASLVPVRGQIARLVPQPEVDYGLTWLGHNLAVVSRGDGLLVQAQAPGDYGSGDTAPDRAASEAAVARLASLYA